MRTKYWKNRSTQIDRLDCHFIRFLRTLSLSLIDRSNEVEVDWTWNIKKINNGISIIVRGWANKLWIRRTFPSFLSSVFDPENVDWKSLSSQCECSQCFSIKKLERRMSGDHKLLMNFFVVPSLSFLSPFLSPSPSLLSYLPLTPSLYSPFVAPILCFKKCYKT